MKDIHVHVYGVLVFRLLSPVATENTLAGNYQILNRGRFDQQLGRLKRGIEVHVLAGGRKGYITTPPVNDVIEIHLYANA